MNCTVCNQPIKRGEGFVTNPTHNSCGSGYFAPVADTPPEATYQELAHNLTMLASGMANGIQDQTAELKELKALVEKLRDLLDDSTTALEALATRHRHSLIWEACQISDTIKESRAALLLLSQRKENQPK